MGDKFWLSYCYWLVCAYVPLPLIIDKDWKTGSIYILILITTAHLKTKICDMNVDILQRLYMILLYPDEGMN